jgi:hypothetical protein
MGVRFWYEQYLQQREENQQLHQQLSQLQRLYTRISAAQVRRQLMKQKGYTDEQLPSAETIRVQLE